MSCGCFSFLASSGAGGAKLSLRVNKGPSRSGNTSLARQQAQRGLREIEVGYRRIADLELPPGTVRVLADLRRAVRLLEPLVQDAQEVKARPWLHPQDGEHADWETVYPRGGTLLRRQICMASDGGEDWFVGGLYISDEGIAFDSALLPGDGAFYTGLVLWRHIERIEKTRDEASNTNSAQTPTVLCLTLQSGAVPAGITKLLLQLSIQRDSEWLEEFWAMCVPTSAAFEQLDALNFVVPAERDTLPAPLPGAGPPMFWTRSLAGGDESARRAERRPSALSPMVQASRSGDLGEAPTILTRRASFADKTPQLGTPRSETSEKRTYVAVNSTDLPTSAVPGEVAPLCSVQLDGVSLQEVRESLLTAGDSWPLVIFLKEKQRAYDMSTTAWSKSSLVPGTYVRKSTYRMPLPKEVPKAVAMLIAMPEDSCVTTAYRLNLQNASEVVFTMQTCTHDVMFGENFRVQEVMSFTANNDGGLDIRKWTDIIWVAALPWTHGAIKGFVEKKAKAESASAVPVLAGILQRCISQKSA